MTYFQQTCILANGNSIDGLLNGDHCNRNLTFKQINTKPELGKQILTTIWDSWDDLWKLRNTSQHGDTPDEKSKLREDNAKSELFSIYNNSHLSVPSDLQYLMSSYKEHAAKPLYIMENWLNFYRGLFKKSLKIAKATATSNTISLTQHFTSSTTHKTPKTYPQSAKCRKVFTSQDKCTTPRLQKYFQITHNKCHA